MLRINSDRIRRFAAVCGGQGGKGRVFGDVFAFVLALALAWPTLAAPLQLQAATVQSVSPQGAARDVRQVAIAFNADMAVLGLETAAAPATVRCTPAASGQGRWMDPRHWTFTFAHDLPLDTQCTVNFSAALRTFGGRPVPDAAPVRFFTSRWQIESVYPDEGDETTETGPIFLRYQGAALPGNPAQTLAARFSCEVRPGDEPDDEPGDEQNDGQNSGQPGEQKAGPGSAHDQTISTRPVLVVDDAQTRRIARAQHYDASVVALRCGAQPLPSGSRIRLRYTDKSGAFRVLNYSVRAPFTATFDCATLSGADAIPGEENQCDPSQPIGIDFSNKPDFRADPASGKTPTRTADGDEIPDPRIRYTDAQGRSSALHSLARLSTDQSLSVDPPANGFGEGARGTLDVPHDLTDVDGRPLANAADFPRTVHFARLPPWLGVPGVDTTLPLSGSQRAPSATLAVRNLEPSLTVQYWRMGGEAGQRTDANALALANWNNPWSAPVSRRPKGMSAEAYMEKRTDELTAKLGAPQSFALKTRGGPLEFVDTPAFTEPGLYVVRAQSPAYARYLKTLAAAHPEREISTSGARYAFVRVTNLNPSASLSNAGRSVVWVSALDTAKPVPDADVAIYSFSGEQRLWRGKTDADGLADVGDALRGKFRRDGRGGNVVWIIVHRGRDFAMLRGSAGATGRVQAWGPQPYRVHTVLDRTLFAAGETVHMEHFARLLDSRGFAAPPATPLKVRIHYDGDYGGSPVAQMTAQLDAQGVGQSTWTIPADARLGAYHVALLHGNDTLASTSFQVEEFRQPNFEMRSDMAAHWVGAQQVTTVNAHVDYYAGGPASGLHVRTTYRFASPVVLPRDVLPRNRDVQPAPGYTFFSEDPVGHLPKDLHQNAVLDAHGDATLRARVPPLARPLLLRSETSFLDANGETVTTGARTLVWPDKLKLGLRANRPSAEGKPATVSGIALDSENRPVAGEPVTVRAARIVARTAADAAAADDGGVRSQPANARVGHRSRRAHRARQPYAVRAARGERSQHDGHDDGRQVRAGAREPASVTLCQTRTARDGTWTCEWALPPVDGTDKTNHDNDRWLLSATDDARTHSFRTVRVALPVERAAVTWHAWQRDASAPPSLSIGHRGDDGSDGSASKDSPSFNPGDVAVLTLRPLRLPATLLLTSEREGVTRALVKSLTQPVERIDWPIRAEDAPNFSLVACYVYPLDAAWGTGETGATGDADKASPAFSQQSTDVSVKPARFSLNVDVRPATTRAHPHMDVPVAVTVRDDAKQPVAGAQVTLVAVDEALLALRENPTWDLARVMLARRGDLVTRTALDAFLTRRAPVGRVPGGRMEPARFGLRGTEDIGSFGSGMMQYEYGSSIDYLAPLAASRAPAAMAPPMPAARETAGTNAAVPSSPSVRQNLAPLIAWRTDLTSDANGVARATIPLNDALTRFRVVAIVTAGAGRFGNGEATITSTQPLQLFSGLPPLLRAGDHLVQTLSVRNTTQAPLYVTLSAVARAHLATDASSGAARTVPMQTDRAAVQARTGQPEQPGPSVQAGQPDRAGRADQSDRSDQTSQPGQPDRPAPGDRASQPGQPDQTSQPDQVNPTDTAPLPGFALEKRLTLAAGETRDVAWPIDVPKGIDAIRWQFTARATRGANAAHAASAADADAAEATDALQVGQKVIPALPVSVRAAMLVNVGNDATGANNASGTSDANEANAPTSANRASSANGANGANTANGTDEANDAADANDANGASIALPIAKPPGAQGDAGGVQVDLQASLVAAALTGPVQWMTTYPYHCLEQQSSRFVTLDDRASWDALMDSLPRYLDKAGFARYFPDDKLDGSETLTMYVLDLARARHWPVPPESRARMLDALTRLVDGRQAALDWAPDDGDLLDQQLAAQATLAEYGRIGVGARNAKGAAGTTPTLAALKVKPRDLSALSVQALLDWGRTLLALSASSDPARAADAPRSSAAPDASASATAAASARTAAAASEDAVEVRTSGTVPRASGRTAVAVPEDTAEVASEDAPEAASKNTAAAAPGDTAKTIPANPAKAAPADKAAAIHAATTTVATTTTATASANATIATSAATPSDAPANASVDTPAASPGTAVTPATNAAATPAPPASAATDVAVALADVEHQLRARYDVVGGRMRWRDEHAQRNWWYMQTGDTVAARAALFVEQLAQRDGAWRPDVPLIVQGLVGRQDEGRWSTTVGNAWGALALRRFGAQVEHGPVAGRTRLTFGNETRTLRWTRGRPVPQAGEAARAGQGGGRDDEPDDAHDGAGADSAVRPGVVQSGARASVQNSPPDGPSGDANAALSRSDENGPTGKEGLQASASAGLAASFAWPRGEQAGASTGLRIVHEGTGRPWAAIRVLAAVTHTTPIVNGLKVTRTLTPVEQKRKGQWSVGDVYRVRLDLEALATQTWVVVRDAVPSGATQLGRGLGGESALARQGEKRADWSDVNPAYVERATDSYRAFFRRVPRGRWSVEYTVRLNNAGAFTLPPVRAEAMYAPEVYGEGVTQTMKVAP